MTLRALFLQAPSFDGYDGGAGARYQMKREVQLVLVSDLARAAGGAGRGIAADRRARARPDLGRHQARGRRQAVDRPPHLDAELPPGRPHRRADPRAQSRGADRAGRRQGRGRAGEVARRLHRHRFRLRATSSTSPSSTSPRACRSPRSTGSAGASRTARSSTTVTARSSRTWTRCRSSRRSTSATSPSRNISAAICSIPMSRSTPGAAARAAAPSACGRRPSAGTTIAPARSAM